jgi:hypothetical protein
MLIAFRPSHKSLIVVSVVVFFGGVDSIKPERRSWKLRKANSVSRGSTRVRFTMVRVGMYDIRSLEFPDNSEKSDQI